MGIYVYRVTKHRVKCSDGKEANVAIFAYKPYMSCFDGALNNKMHFRSGATASDRMAREGRITGRLVSGDEHGRPYPNAVVYENKAMLGSFYDTSMGSDRMPILKDIRVA